MVAPNQPPSEAASLPLANMRIVDFGWSMAGPQATRILADFGAEVLKVESQTRPDLARISFLPRFDGRFGINRSAYFHDFNRNKRSMSLNMTKPEARALVGRLIKLSDVVLDNFSAGVLDRWGLGYKEMSKSVPGIIYISMSGLGSYGPYSAYRTFGPTAQALSGMAYLNGHAGMPPAAWGFSFMDHNAGYLSAIAVMAAYFNRLETGVGQCIEQPQLEASLYMTGTSILDYQANGRQSVPPGNDPPYSSAAPQGVYRSLGEDCWIALAVRGDKEWEAFCRVIGLPELASDARFSSFAARCEHKEELNRIVEAWTGQHDNWEAMYSLQEAGIAAGVVSDTREFWEKDPQIQQLGLKVPFTHPENGEAEAPVRGTPIRLSQAQPRRWRHGPLLGQDNGYIFHELLGLEEEEVENLVKTGVAC